MKIWSKIPLAVKILVPGVTALALLSSLQSTPQAAPITISKAPSVNIITAQASDHRIQIESQGSVAPRREINVVAQVAGEVISVKPHYVDGGFFGKGETLIQIDPRDYEFALVDAKQRLAEAQEYLAQERGRSRQAKREWRDLGNSDANNLFLRKPQLASATARLNSAEAAVQRAQLNLERTTIKLPFAGRIRETLVDLGQYVTPGVAIARAYDTEVAEIRLPITDRQAALIDLPLGFQANSDNPGPAVDINGVIGTKRYHWAGRITRTEASIDTRSRMYYAIAEVVDPFNQQQSEDQNSNNVPLIVGLFVKASIDGRELNNVIRLPNQSVFNRDQIYRVENETVIAEKVEVLHRNAEFVWIHAEHFDGTSIMPGKQGYVTPGLTVAATLLDLPNEHQLEHKAEKQIAANHTGDL